MTFVRTAGQEVKAVVRNVWLTVHLDTGDFEMRNLTAISVNGSTAYYTFRQTRMPQGGSFNAVTIHLGEESQRRPVALCSIASGSDLTVEQPLISELA